MNLHGIVSGAISAVNPSTEVLIYKSIGYAIADDGRQTPQYSRITTQGQVQSLSSGDIRRLESLGVQGVNSKIYLNGGYEGLFRALGKGGDLIKLGGIYYLVSQVLERWPDWCCLALTAQSEAINMLIPESIPGIQSGNPAAFYRLPAGSSVSAIPTAAGSARVYVSTSNPTACAADVAANAVGSGQAAWSLWSSGQVATLSQEVVLGDIAAVALVALSGTWTLEVVTHE